MWRREVIVNLMCCRVLTDCGAKCCEGCKSGSSRSRYSDNINQQSSTNQPHHHQPHHHHHRHRRQHYHCAAHSPRTRGAFNDRLSFARLHVRVAQSERCRWRERRHCCACCHAPRSKSTLAWSYCWFLSWWWYSMRFFSSHLVVEIFYCIFLVVAECHDADQSHHSTSSCSLH